MLNQIKSEDILSSKEDDIDEYLKEINNINYLINNNFLTQGNIFYNIVNNNVIYVDPKTGEVPNYEVLEKSFYDEVMNWIIYKDKHEIIEILEEKSFSTFDLEGNIMYTSYYINDIKKIIWISTDKANFTDKKELEIVAKNNNWFFDKNINLWCKWNENKYRSWLDIEWNPASNFPSTIEEDELRNLDRKDYEKLPFGLRPPKLDRQKIVFHFPKPKLICEINELDKNGYPIIIK